MFWLNDHFRHVWFLDLSFSLPTIPEVKFPIITLFLYVSIHVHHLKGYFDLLAREGGLFYNMFQGERASSQRIAAANLFQIIISQQNMPPLLFFKKGSITMK